MRKSVQVFWFTPSELLRCKRVGLKALRTMLQNQYKFDILGLNIDDKDYDVTIKDDSAIKIAIEYLKC